MMNIVLAIDVNGAVRPARGQRAITNAVVGRWEGAQRTAGTDALAVEEPCEIRLEGEPVAVVMRTPGNDRELAAGFLFTEGIVGPGDIERIEHGSQRDVLHGGNVVDVRLAPGVKPKRGWQRQFYATSSCGICGTASIQAIRRHAPPLGDGPSIDRAMLAGLADRLRHTQEVFSATGGLHGAALFRATGALLAAREDIGRHNAVDKLIGYALLAGTLPLADTVLLVSGRTSFEIVQKALMARIPILAGVSAGSSLAVRLAAQSNMTLIGFLRGSRMNVYTGEQRISVGALPRSR